MASNLFMAGPSLLYICVINDLFDFMAFPNVLSDFIRKEYTKITSMDSDDVLMQSDFPNCIAMNVCYLWLKYAVKYQCFAQYYHSSTCVTGAIVILNDIMQCVYLFRIFYLYISTRILGNFCAFHNYRLYWIIK